MSRTNAEIFPKPSPHGADDWFVDGVTGDLTARVSTWPEATVIGRVVWSEMRDVPRAELASLIGDAAGGIARTLMVEFGDAVAAAAPALAPEQALAQLDLIAPDMLTTHTWTTASRLST
ncbi:MAG: hypothetical protein ABJA49_12100 [Betaproteobacteria bacterium]